MATSKDVFWPVDPRTVSEEAGTRGGTHYGMDFAVREGTPVLASFDGVVVWVGNDGASGFLPGTNIKANGPALIVDIQRDDGLIARYAHLSQFWVKQGQRVAAGNTIALSGNTGFTTGPHLHWELRWDRSLGPGAWVNPRNFNPQIFTIEEDDMFTDDDRRMLQETKRRADACYDALFKTTPTTRGEHAGVLRMTNAIYDAQFKETETSRGTPGGTLVNDRITLAKLDAIIEHFGIEVPDVSGESDATDGAE